MKQEFTQSELLEELRKGNDAAFTLVYNEYRHSIKSYVLRFTRDDAAADDIYNDVMILLWQNRASIESNLRAYIYAIARSICLSQKKYKTRIMETIANYTRIIPKDEYVQTQQISINELMLALEAAIKTLPPQQQAIIEKVYRENPKLNKIADELNTSETTIKNQKHKAFFKLKFLLKMYLAEHEIGDILISLVALCISVAVLLLKN
ncbi:MAG: sigma-70 family RNA polymerase sigma factor [Chitinophagaceae bacterium]